MNQFVGHDYLKNAFECVLEPFRRHATILSGTEWIPEVHDLDAEIKDELAARTDSSILGQAKAEVTTDISTTSLQRRSDRRSKKPARLVDHIVADDSSSPYLQDDDPDFIEDASKPKTRRKKPNSSNKPSRSNRPNDGGGDEGEEQDPVSVSEEQDVTTVKGKRTFGCRECGVTFKSKGSLVAHDRIHKDVKPFHCRCESNADDARMC